MTPVPHPDVVYVKLYSQFVIKKDKNIIMTQKEKITLDFLWNGSAKFLVQELLSPSSLTYTIAI